MAGLQTVLGSANAIYNFKSMGSIHCVQEGVYNAIIILNLFSSPKPTNPALTLLLSRDHPASYFREKIHQKNFNNICHLQRS